MVYRLVYLSADGTPQHFDYPTLQPIHEQYEQIGVEEDSYTLWLHGEPIFRGLIGPLSDGKNTIRYETPEAFTLLTEQWAKDYRNRRRRGART